MTTDDLLSEARRHEVERLRNEVEKIVRYTEITVQPAENWPAHTATLVLLCAIWRRLDVIEKALEERA